MVAIISTVLARRGRVGAWGRATHLCALMMITVTAIVYATLIGPYEVLSGFALVTNPYGFVNVWRIGYTQVAINIVAILVGALGFMALFAGADWLIRKASRR